MIVIKVLIVDQAGSRGMCFSVNGMCLSVNIVCFTVSALQILENVGACTV